MRVLVVVNGWPPADRGGAAIYAQQHARMLARRHGDEVSVLTRETDPARPEYDVRESNANGLRLVTVNNTFRDVRQFADSYAPPAVDRLAERLIAELEPDVAHVHHLTGLSTSIVPLLAAANVPTVFTLHDYWLLCHRGQLLDVNLAPCAGPTPAGCTRCIGAAAMAPPLVSAVAPVLRRAARLLPAAPAFRLREAAGHALGRLAGGERHDVARTRIEHMRDIGCMPARLLAPSAHMRERALGFGLPADRIIVWRYGFDHERFAGASKSDGGPLRIAFLGSLMVSKAPHVLIEAFARLPAGCATLTLVGQVTAYHGDASYARRLDAFAGIPGLNLRGPVSHDEIPGVLADADVLVVPSIWEENSPLVIGEAFLAGVPVVASRTGGIPEAVTDGVNGLLVAPGSVDELHRALARLVDDPRLLPRLRSGVPEVRRLDEDVDATRGLYRVLVGANRPAAPAARVAAVVLNYRTSDDTLLAVRSIAASRMPVSDIVVVDQASDGSCRRALDGVGADLVLLEQRANLGFPAGANVGIRVALERGATHVLLVNSDVILPPDTTAALVESLAGHPGAGIAAPVLLSRARPGVIASAGMTYAPRSGRMRHPGAGRPYDAAAAPRWIEVDGVSGGVMLVEASVFARLGLLPEEYFFSFEDLAFCLRARDAGIRCGIAGHAVAYHEGARTMGAGSPRRLYFAARNHLHLASGVPAGGPLTAALRSASIVGLNLAHAVRAPGAHLTARVGAVVRGIRDHFRGRYGPGPAA